MKLLYFDDFKLGVLKGDAVVDVTAEVNHRALGINRVQHVELFLGGILGHLGIGFLEDENAGEALFFVSVIDLLEVSLFLVATQATTGKAHKHRPLARQLGQVDHLARGILDLEPGRLFTDSNFLGDWRIRHAHGGNTDDDHQRGAEPTHV